MIYDIIIIGGGVTGCAVAEALSKYRARICVIERREDICEGTSKANSGIVHAGFDAEPGSLKARMNVRGSAMMEELCRRLDVPFRRNGSLVLCPTAGDTGKTPDPAGLAALKVLKEKGERNGVCGLEILDYDRLHALEPNLAPTAAAALYAPTGGIVCPFSLTIALAENACINGAEFRRGTMAAGLSARPDGIWQVQTDKGILEARTVVNAAGVYADVLHNLVSPEKIHITARKGEYCLFDHTVGDYVNHTIFQLPTKMGKGVLVTPTVHGNLLIGPTAVDIEDREGIQTTRAGLDTVLTKAEDILAEVPARQVITSFAGLRAHADGDDFIIGEAAGAPGFFDAAGIASPGLSSAPAIGEILAGMIAAKLKLELDPAWTGERQAIPQVHTLSFEERSALIQRRPDYGSIICRCEMISEGEILDAIRRPVGARSLDGVKRRTRAGMGRCQAGFCAPRVMEILSRELQMPMEEVTKCGGASRMLVRENDRAAAAQADTQKEADA